MPKPSYRPKKKSASTYKDYDSGNQRESDTGTSKRAAQNKTRAQTKAFVDSGQSRTRQTDTGHSKRAAQNKARRVNENWSDYQSRSPKVDRYTDTGDSRRKAQAKQNRINKQFNSSTGAKRERMTDTGTGRSAKVNYGNRDATKRTLQKKYGNARQKPSLYDRANYKGQEMERKVKRKWKPSDTPSQRPDENGREWGNHKYIDKVKTKSGKIRYIYEVEGGGSKQQDAGKTMRQNQNSKSASQKNHNLAPARKVAKSARAFLKGLFG